MSSSDLPTLSAAQVKELDRVSSERFGVPVTSLMEAAGICVARFCDGPTIVVCGPGNNGGDGLVCARRLHHAGKLAGVCCVDSSRYRGPAAEALRALQADGVAVSEDIEVGNAELIVDAIFGVGLSRPPSGTFAAWINVINDSTRRVIAVDVPSGLDADTGVAYDPCVRANVTVTFGLPKKGLVVADGPGMAGEVWVADIGIPREAYGLLGIEVPDGLFDQASTVRL